MGNKATREIPEALGTFRTLAAAWDRRIQSGQAGGGMSARFTQVGRPRALAMWARLDRSHRGRRAAGRGAAAAAGQRAQRRRHDVGLGGSEGVPARRDRQPTSAIRRSTPNGPIYGALEASADYMPVVDPIEPHGDADQAEGARSEDAERGRDAAGAAVAVLGRRSDLDQPVERAQLRDGQAGARLDCGAHPSEPDAGLLSSRARRIRRPRRFRSARAAGRCRCTTRRRRR